MDQDVKRNQENALLEECRSIAGKCWINAQMQFNLAAAAERRSFWLLVIPAFIAATAGVLTSIDAFPALSRLTGAFGAAAAALVAVFSALGVDRKYIAHCQAGNAMTVLHNEARALYKTFWQGMSQESLSAQIRSYDDRYNTIISLIPISSDEAHKKVRQKLDAAVELEEKTNQVTDRSALDVKSAVG